MKEDTVYNARKNSQTDMVPSKEKSVFGYYDPAIKTALIYLSKAKIDSYNIDKRENPTLYLRLEKTSYYEDITFNKFDIEARVAGINDHVVPAEKIYHYGKMGADQSCIFYPLKLARNKLFLRIQVALNSEQLDFSISEESRSTTNTSFSYMRDSRERGKVMITIQRTEEQDKLYLNFFRKDKSKIDERLSNYAFKYINGESEMDFFDYKMMYPNITITEENEVINCTFNKVHGDSDDYEIMYFLKVVDNSTYIYGEEMNTIAVTESPSLIYYHKNPIPLDGDPDKISITAQKDYSSKYAFENYAYINVIAQIQQKNIIEYVAYNGIMKIRPPTPSSDDTDRDQSDKPPESTTNNAVIFGVVGGILGAIVIGLVVVIVYFQMKNRNLLNKVKHVSFQKTNTNMDPNLLLQKQQEINPS